MTQVNQGQVSTDVQQADEDRTKRVFIGFLSSVLGVDQTYANEDGYVGTPTDQYRIANPDGSYSVTGRARSNVQGAAPQGLQITPGLLLLGLVAFFLLKK